MAKKSYKANYTPSPGQIGWGLLYLIFQFLALPELIMLIPLKLTIAQQNLIYYAINFLAALIIFRTYLANHLTSLGRNWWPCLKALILGYVFYWVSSYCVSWCLPRLIPGFANLNDSAIAAMTKGNFWLMAIGTVLLVPLTEEVFFRGLIFGSLYSRNRAAAYILSCLLFSAVHVVGYMGSANVWVLLGCFVQYLPAGLCLAWSFQESGSLFVPIIIHTLVNALGIWALR